MASTSSTHGGRRRRHRHRHSRGRGRSVETQTSSGEEEEEEEKEEEKEDAQGDALLKSVRDMFLTYVLFGRYKDADPSVDHVRRFLLNEYRRALRGQHPQLAFVKADVFSPETIQRELQWFRDYLVTLGDARRGAQGLEEQRRENLRETALQRIAEINRLHAEQAAAEEAAEEARVKTLVRNREEARAAYKAEQLREYMEDAAERERKQKAEALAKAPETKPPPAKPSESKVADTKAQEKKAKAPETKPSPAKPSESKVADTKAQEKKVKAPETKPADAKAQETKSAGAKAPETKPADAKAQETKPASAKAQEKKPADAKAPETKSASAKAQEKKPADAKAPETNAKAQEKKLDAPEPAAAEPIVQAVNEPAAMQEAVQATNEPAAAAVQATNEPAAAATAMQEANVPVAAMQATNEPAAAAAAMQEANVPVAAAEPEPARQDTGLYLGPSSDEMEVEAEEEEPEAVPVSKSRRTRKTTAAAPLQDEAAYAAACTRFRDALKANQTAILVLNGAAARAAMSAAGVLGFPNAVGECLHQAKNVYEAEKRLRASHKTCLAVREPIFEYILLHRPRAVGETAEQYAERRLQMYDQLRETSEYVYTSASAATNALRVLLARLTDIRAFAQSRIESDEMRMAFEEEVSQLPWEQVSSSMSMEVDGHRPKSEKALRKIRRSLRALAMGLLAAVKAAGITPIHEDFARLKRAWRTSAKLLVLAGVVEQTSRATSGFLETFLDVANTRGRGIVPQLDPQRVDNVMRPGICANLLRAISRYVVKRPRLDELLPAEAEAEAEPEMQGVLRERSAVDRLISLGEMQTRTMFARMFTFFSSWVAHARDTLGAEEATELEELRAVQAARMEQQQPQAWADLAQGFARFVDILNDAEDEGVWNYTAAPVLPLDDSSFPVVVVEEPRGDEDAMDLVSEKAEEEGAMDLVAEEDEGAMDLVSEEEEEEEHPREKQSADVVDLTAAAGEQVQGEAADNDSATVMSRVREEDASTDYAALGTKILHILDESEDEPVGEQEQEPREADHDVGEQEQEQEQEQVDEDVIRRPVRHAAAAEPRLLEERGDGSNSSTEIANLAKALDEHVPVPIQPSVAAADDDNDLPWSWVPLAMPAPMDGGVTAARTYFSEKESSATARRALTRLLTFVEQWFGLRLYLTLTADAELAAARRALFASLRPLSFHVCFSRCAQMLMGLNTEPRADLLAARLDAQHRQFQTNELVKTTDAHALNLFRGRPDVCLDLLPTYHESMNEPPAFYGEVHVRSSRNPQLPLPALLRCYGSARAFYVHVTDVFRQAFPLGGELRVANPNGDGSTWRPAEALAQLLRRPHLWLLCVSSTRMLCAPAFLCVELMERVFGDAGDWDEDGDALSVCLLKAAQAIYQQQFNNNR